MYILKTERDQNYFYIYWTLDGEHIFRVQKTPIKEPKGNNRNELAY